MPKEFVAVLLGILIVAFSATAGAQPLVFPLEGDREVPPVTTDATGACEATVSAGAFDISCTHDVVDLVAAHIHMAPRGVNGPIVFFFDFTTNFSASVTAESLEEQAMTFPVTPVSFSEFISLLNSGDLYVNVHSPANPGGEIRGQIPIPPSLFFPQFGNGDDGSGNTLTSDIVLLNTASTGDPLTASVELRDPDGNPLDVGFEGNGIGEVTIGPREAVTFRTDGQGDLAVGSASVSASGPVAGVIRFSIPGFGVAGVQSSSPLSRAIVPARNEGDIRTALAIRNTSNAAIVIVVWCWGFNLDPVEEVHFHTTLEFPLFGQRALFIDELFVELAGMQFVGTVSLETEDGTFAAIALEQGPGVFTTLPFTPLR